MQTLPSKKYPQFIAAFEEYVTKRQEDISAVEKLQQVYIIVREALCEANLPNSISIQLYPKKVYVSIYATEEDKSSILTDLCKNIQKKLFDAKLREDRTPSSTNGGEFRTMERNFFISNDIGYLDIVMWLPNEGIQDYMIESEIHTYQQIRHTIKPRPSIHKYTL